MTKLNAATPSNPSHLPDRYEIRRLTSEHTPWVKAIVIHSNIAHSPVWTKIFPTNRAQKMYDMFHAADYLCKHQIDSGHSFGVFDLEYKYKRAESEATGGKLYWDEENPAVSDAELLQQMDFPLASVALAYDGVNPLDMEEVMKLVAVLPQFGTVYHHLEVLDPRPPASWKATGPNQVLMRNATSTRHDAETKGLMRRLAEFLMRYAAELGFRGAQIECLHDRVTEVWSNPPKPFEGRVVCQFEIAGYKEEQEVDGKTVMVNPFEPAQQMCSKVYVDL